MSHKLDCLLLHGWGVNNDLLNDFAATLKGFDKVMLPNLYEEAEKTEDYNISSIAKNLSDTFASKALVIAWSIGGLIATQLALATNKVKAIIFIGSTPCFINKDGWSNVIDKKNINNLQLDLLNNTVKTLEYFAGLIAHGDASEKETNNLIRHSLADEKHVDILYSFLLQMQEIDQRKDFAELTVPTLYIFGENDSLINSKIEKQIKQLNESVQTNVIYNCGHAPFLSKQAQSRKIINEFIDARFS